MFAGVFVFQNVFFICKKPAGYGNVEIWLLLQKET